MRAVQRAVPSAGAPPRPGKNRRYAAPSRKSTLLPPALYAFFVRRMVDCGGVALILAALVLAACFVSYNHRDPSANHATDSPPSNFLGVPGAYTADLFLVSLGLAAPLLPFALGVWGLFILQRRLLSRWWLRILALLLCLLSLSLLLSFLPLPLFGTAGGSAGFMLRTLFDHELRSTLGPVAPIAVAAAALLTSTLLLVAALGFTLNEWRAGFSRSARLSKGAAEHATDIALAVGSQTRGLAGWRPGSTPGLRPVAEQQDEPPEIDIFTVEESEAPAKAPKRKPVVIRKAAPLARPDEPELLPANEYAFPPLTLLQLPGPGTRSADLSPAALEARCAELKQALSDFGVRGEIVRISPGPVVTLYELEPAPGTKSSRVINLADDIARSLSAVSVRVAVVPGRNVIGIELPNSKRETVYLRELLAEPYERGAMKLAMLLGKDIGGQPIIADLARMPHLLVAGTTGSGKSVAVNTMILSLLYRLSPEQCRFIMIDPKMLELSVYDGIPHLLAPVVTEPKRAVVALKWTVREMEERYRAMSKLGVRNVEGYNTRLREAKANGETLTRKVQTGFDPDTGKPLFEDQAIDLQELHYIVVVVDEFADLMLVAGKDIEGAIQRLAQMARAAGIHLIMATQRPSVDVITGTIKANFPTRISFAVTSKIDSRTILGESGAEQLLGQGDMLYMASGGRITRVHGPFVKDDEVEQVVAFLKRQGEPNYVDGVTDDDGDWASEENADSGYGGSGDEGSGGNDLYDKAVALVARERKASTSFVQRHFQIGYNKAARLIERMEKEGVVSTANHVGKREVLVPRHGGDD